MNAYEVAGQVRVPYRTLMNWVENGLLTPEGAGRGHRHPTTWHPKDLREASVLAALRRAGFSMQRLRQALDYLKSLGHNPMSTGRFIVVRGGRGHPRELIKICEDGQEALALIREQGQMLLPLLPEGKEGEDG